MKKINDCFVGLRCDILFFAFLLLVLRFEVDAQSFVDFCLMS